MGPKPIVRDVLVERGGRMLCVGEVSAALGACTGVGESEIVVWYGGLHECENWTEATRVACGMFELEGQFGICMQLWACDRVVVPSVGRLLKCLSVRLGRRLLYGGSERNPYLAIVVDGESGYVGHLDPFDYDDRDEYNLIE